MSRQNIKCGYLELIMGCMFSGKSTSLNKVLFSYSLNNLSIIKIINSKVEGVERNISTCGILFEKGVNLIYTNTLEESTIYDNYDVIGIDEGQFFGIEIISFVEKYLVKKKIIIIAGLIADFKREKFGHLLDMLPSADKLKYKKAYCSECRYSDTNIIVEASFSKRTTDSKEQTEVGNKYIPVCRFHYETK